LQQQKNNNLPEFIHGDYEIYAVIFRKISGGNSDGGGLFRDGDIDILLF